MKVNMIFLIYFEKTSIFITMNTIYSIKTTIFNLIGQKKCHFNFFDENYTSSIDETTLQYQNSEQ